MPTSPIALSVSDPISAMVVAALDFLQTPLGQDIGLDLRDVIHALFAHVNSKLAIPAATPVASALPKPTVLPSA